MGRIWDRVVAGLLVLVLVSGSWCANAAEHQVEGTLQQGDLQLESGELLDSFTFDLKEGQYVWVTLTSAAFDPGLYVTAPDGMRTYSDDFYRDSTTAAAEFLVTQEGTWTFWAAAAEAGKGGAYQLSFTIHDTRVDQTIQGELTPTDQFSLKTGEFCDTYPLDMQPNQMVIVRMTSRDFDTYLTAYGVFGRVFNDDCYSAAHSVIFMRCGADGGAASIVATGYDESCLGSYTIEYLSIVEEQE